MLVVIIGALGTWWLKSRDKDIETRKLESQTRLSELELQHKLKREDNQEEKKRRKDIMDEKDELIHQLHRDLETQREELHKLRNESNSLRLRVELCEQERRYMGRQITALLMACRDANIKVAMPVDPPPSSQSPNPSPGGGQS
jgi:uncharacterized protein HemX